MNVSLSHPVLEEMRSRGIPFTVAGEHIEIDGFGKSGVVKLVAHENGSSDAHALVLHTRYEGRNNILTFDDLLAQAWYWLKVSLSKNDDHYCVHENWRGAFIEKGWLPEDTLPWVSITRATWEAGEENRLCST